MKYTKNYNARAQPLFCSLNLMLSDVVVAAAVAVVVFLNSLMAAGSGPFDLCEGHSLIKASPFEPI